MPSRTSRSKVSASTLTAARSSAIDLPVGPQRAAVGGVEAAAQPHQGLLQAVARLAVAALAPQQAGEALARMRVPRRHRQVGEQGALLLARQIDDRAGRQPDLESAEQVRFRSAIAASSMTGLFTAKRRLQSRLTWLSRGTQRPLPAGGQDRVDRFTEEMGATL